MKDAKSRGSVGAVSTRAKQMAELATIAKRLGSGSWASAQLKYMKAGDSYKQAEMKVQSLAEEAMKKPKKKMK